MSSDQDKREEWQARRLAARLEGERVGDMDEETSGLAEFAGRLPWQEGGPSPAFQERLRRELLRRARPAARAGLPVRRLLPYAAAGLLVAMVALAVFWAVGFRIGGVFGTVYDRLVPGDVESEDKASYLRLEQQAIVVTPVPAPPRARDTAQATVPVFATVPPEPTAAPAASPVPGAPLYPEAGLGRMVIKSAEMEIQVGDTDATIDRITGIVAQYGGYIVSAHTWYDDGYKAATMVLGVPVDTFEQVLRRVREVADAVTREAVSGQDVSDQYVDLTSQLRNLEATETRLRSFLDQATTVKEALEVSVELSKVQQQIELVKGRMQYLEGRSAYSTVTIEIRPPRPIPTPTPTPTAAAWRPGQTYEKASGALISVLHLLVEALIWIAVVAVPIVGLPVLILFLVRWMVRRQERRPG